MKRHYYRHLPHQIPEGFPIFLTWNLKGALPKAVLQMLDRERTRLASLPKRVGESRQDRKIREGKLIFAMADRALDNATSGPMHLHDPAAAKIVEEAIIFGVADRYELYAWCIMSNHAHVLFTPHCELRKISQGIKGHTSYEINGIQNARGRTFWQDESFDHWARDDDELFRIIEYIENNPVAAGLCQCQNDWQWSSARHRKDWPRGQAFVKP
jgi:REP element-mobilizing transposase RayT